MEVLIILMTILSTVISLWIISFIIFVCLERKYLIEQKEINQEVEYVCPKCGGSVGYLTLLHHFETQKDGSKIPVYGSSARCLKCGFKTKNYIDDTNDDILKELKRLYKNEN